MPRWTLVVIALSFACVLTACEQQEFSNKKAAMRDQWEKSRSTMVAQLAVEAYEHGELTQARDRCLEALSTDRDNLSLRLLLVRIYIEQGDYDAAKRHLTLLQQQDPRTWEVPYYLGVCAERQHYFHEALKSYDKAHELAPQAVEPVQAATEVLVQMNRIPEAQARLNGKIDPSAPDPHLCELAGRLAMRQNDHTTAATYLELAHETDPENLRYPEMLADCHRQNGNYDQVVTLLEAQMQNPRYKPRSHVYLMLGEAYLARGQVRQAINYFEQATSQTPDSVETWNALCGAYLADSNYRKAIDAGRKAEHLAPDNAETSLLLGFSLLKNGDVDQATFVLQNAVRRNPNDALALCVLGKAMLKQGKTAEAQRLFSQAGKLNPSSPMAKTLAKQVTQ